MKHTKPTQAELDAQIEAAITEAEVKEDAKVEEVETPEVKDEAPPEVPKEEVVDEKVEEVETPAEVKEEVDYRKKFTNSAREAQILAANNEKINQAVEAAKSLPEPTEAELTKEFPEWDIMSDTEKKLAKKNFIAERRFDLIHEASLEGKDVREWNKKVDAFVEDPKSLTQYPLLEGKIEDFKLFAAKKSHRGTDFEVLVSSFLWNAEQTKPKNKGEMMPSGTAGQNKKSAPNDGKLSLAEGKILMENNYSEYRRLVKEGKIAYE